MDDEFAQTVRVHRVFDDAAAPAVMSRVDTAHPATVQRLGDRAHATARTMLHPLVVRPVAQDATDELLDRHVIDPNRQAIARRTLALERWLADHGFRGGRPLRFLRGNRDAHYHGERRDLAVARPVFRDSIAPADQWLTPIILRSLAWQPALAAPALSRVSLVAGFLVLELPTTDLHELVHTSQTQLTDHDAFAIAELPAGPVLITTRDVTSERLVHALEHELAYELAAVGDYRHARSLPTPAELAAHPARGWQLPHEARQRQYLDRLAKASLTERLRHLPHACQLDEVLTLSDLGFSPHDWAINRRETTLDPITRQVASVYLGSLLLGKVLVAAWNDHPEAYTGFVPVLDTVLADVQCAEAWHPHYHYARHYQNFVRAATTGDVGGPFLDGIYRKSVDPTLDFAHAHGTHHPVRLHVTPRPFHPSVDR